MFMFLHLRVPVYGTIFKPPLLSLSLSFSLPICSTTTKVGQTNQFPSFRNRLIGLHFINEMPLRNSCLQIPINLHVQAIGCIFEQRK